MIWHNIMDNRPPERTYVLVYTANGVVDYASIDYGDEHPNFSDSYGYEVDQVTHWCEVKLPE